jgi:hypothetical protein
MASNESKCLHCKDEFPGLTLGLVKAPCGCDLRICDRCLKAPVALAPWLGFYAAHCIPRQHVVDVEYHLSA